MSNIIPLVTKGHVQNFTTLEQPGIGGELILRLKLQRTR